MKTEVKKLVATTLILSFFGLPSTLQAQGRRGANLVITLKDSSQVRGSSSRSSLIRWSWSARSGRTSPSTSPK